ncbi:hypothetical protein [Rhodococcus sp. 14-1411-2a]|uniref:hypothetical protein n=1 Tax=Rhodococcus sp. 14-1411-2a TaxID=2023151 RepID=UPI000B9C6F02|nr:hypothetical protein [Rhodococcus sp. 14-1411-2a]OZF42514.1 hypothetical protein CH291_26370 [Rhodococcus sp. 14-1411-2a]
MTDTTTAVATRQMADHRQSTHTRSTGDTVNVGDRYHLAPGAPGIVVVREIQPEGLILVENETPGPGVYPYLVKPDTLVPATT